MDKINFKQLLQEHPECVSNGAKIKAFLKDLYPDVPKAIVNTLTIMANDGIISEMQMSAESSTLVAARLQKKLEDDYGLSQKIISECFSLIIYDSAKQPQTTNNARSHENINASAVAPSKSASKEEKISKNTTKLGKKPLPQSTPAIDNTVKQTNRNFVIKKGVLETYKGRASVVVIPDGVTSIGKWAFYRRSSLTSITIPDSVTSIGESAFYECSSLTNITIPDSVTSIGEHAFSNCSKLTSITIPNSVTSIDAYAFSGCTGLTSVTIGNSATSIDAYAFSGCTGLTSVTIPDSVTSIGFSAFSGCTGLTSVIIGNSVTSIDAFAFKDCTGLTSVTIGNSVTSIGNYAFTGCKGLTSITIGNSVTSIDASAFSGCTGLTSVTIGNSVTSIGEAAFYGCSKLQDIYITDIAAWCNILGLYNLMKYGTSNKKLYINNELVTTLTIPADVTSIGTYAFYDCGGLTSITIPDSVTSIGEHAFCGCSGLTSVTIGNGVTSITIPNSVTSIGSSAFSGCDKLQDIYITDIAAWCNILGLYNLMKYGTSNKKLYINNELVTTLTIPADVTSIGTYAFYGCSSLTSITIPDSVTSIDWDAFNDTTWYNNQPDGLVYAGKVAYKYKGEMPSNTSIVLKEGTLGIADYAFDGCTGLTSITIPDSVTNIGDAFYGCTGLTSITYKGTTTQWKAINKDIFWNCNVPSCCKVYCVDGFCN